MATGRRTLQNDPRLRPFIIPNARPTGTNLGGGSYGSVEELMINGFVCAGKKIHEILLQMGNYGVENIAQKYVQECQLMSDLRHPHLVQFMGVCFLSDSSLPVLVMERLLMSLDDLLENTPDIPLALKRSILADICKGLVYLHNHSPPVIHRDLSAKNVLLNSAMVAKISDLGNSRIIDLRPGQLARTLSRIPGTTSYMPPEAFDETSRYGTRLDVFSLGHLALFTVTQVFPGSLKPGTYADPDDPDRILGRSEVERRSDYIDQLHQRLGEGHPLVRMVKQCLHNVPSRRPSTEEVLQQLEGMRDQIQDPYHHMTKLEMMTTLKQKDLELSSQLQRSTDGSTQHELEQLQIQMQQLQLVTDGKDRTVGSLRAQLNQKETQMNTVQREFRGLQMQLQRLQLETDGKDRMVDSLRAQLNQKETEMNTVQQQLRRLQSESSAQLAARDRLLVSTRVDLETQLREKEREKDAEISRLQGELRSLRQSQLERAQAKPIRGLTLPLRLRWKRCKDMPHQRHDAYVVVIQRRVYVGGGDGGEEAVVMVYDPHSDQWSQLPPYEFRLFGMAAVNDQLVLVGGRDGSKRTNRLGVWDEKSHQWTEPYPPMKAVRTSPSVVAHEKWLVVAGWYDGSDALDRVEILDTTTRQWYSAAPLPQRCGWMKSALVGDTLYLMGGNDGNKPVMEVFTVFLPALIRQATTPSEAASPAASQTLWQTLPPTPLGHSAALALRGSLLAIGGQDDNREITSAIYLYQPSTRKKWVKVGDLPTARDSCVSTLLPSGEFLVLGGSDDHSDDYYGTIRVDMATVQ